LSSNHFNEKEKTSMSHSFVAKHFSGRPLLRAALLCFAILLIASSATPVFAQYVRTNLVSNQQGVGTNTPDSHLVNAWGLTALQPSPFWISDNGTGFSTLYDGAGNNQGLFVAIPASPNSPANAPGTPTGTVGNISVFTNPPGFVFTSTGTNQAGPALFIFSTLDGTISAWGFNSPVDNAGNSQATLVADRSKAGASYTGLAIAQDSHGNFFLFAADGGPNRAIDIYNSNFTYMKSVSDPAIPKGFTTYGIQAIHNHIWVTFTPLNKAQGGFVDVFDADGNLEKHDAIHGPLHSPWGIALAPSDFGPMSGAILISNNISRGQINAFNPETGEFLGPLLDANDNPIEIDNVWALQFGQDGAGNANGAHNQLFFTGGPNGYANGIFGVITFGK
jgi:uncharacterized protein (TIGR03118 family)